MMTRRKILIGASTLVAAPFVLQARFAKAAAMDWQFDPRDFGAKWDGAADDTAAINKAFDAARQVGGTLALPPGTGGFLAGGLNFTQTLGGRSVRVIGSGSAWGGSILKAIGSTGSYPHALDLCGAKGIKLQDFVVTTAPNVTALSGLFMASALGGYDLDMTLIDNLYVSGNFTAGALYAACHASSAYRACKFYNYNNGGQPAIFLSKTNGWNLGSNFAQVANRPQDYGVSDLTFDACEIHDMSDNPGSYATFLDGCSDIRFFGGNVSQNHGHTAYHLGVNNPTRVGFYGTSHYTDSGPAPSYVFEIPSGHTMTTVLRDQFSAAQFAIAEYSSGAHT